MAIFEFFLLISIKDKKNPQKHPSENTNKRAEKVKRNLQKSRPTQSSKVVSWEQYFAMLTYLSMC